MAKYSLEDIKVPAGKRHDHDPPLIKRRKKDGNIKPMLYANLHGHSTYSYDDGYQLPEAHIRRAEELNMVNGLAFTEHGNISSHVKAEKAAEKIGLPVLFGCEVYTGKVGDGATQRKYHLTILAKDAEGYRNLVHLVTRSWKEGFYYEATVSWQMLKEHKRGLILLSGCQGSLLFCSAVGGKLIPDDEANFGRALAVAKAFRKEFGENYFIEVQAFPELEKTRAFNAMAGRLSRLSGAPLVATMDTHYTTLDEREIQKILHNARPGQTRTLEQQVREWGYDAPLCPPPNDKNIYRRLRESGLTKGQAIEAIANTALIAKDCKVVLPKLPMVKFPLPAGYKDTREVWRDWLKQGWRFRNCHRLPQAERDRYKAQLAHEMEMIEGKDYVDYFLIVSDLIKFAKDEGVPFGPGRGSSAASLVCWLLRITEVNPMEFPQLVFERFIDITREDLPDIDIDVPGESRAMIRDYAVARYGRECVNNLGTRTMYKAKLALDTVGRVFQIPKPAVETVKELLIERSSGDLRASATIEDTIEQFDRAREVAEEYPDIRKATLLEGNAKGEGVHAAGLIISNGPITDVCSFIVREVPKGSGRMVEVVTHDKYDAERQGLLKIDLLGLNTMSMLWEACRWCDMNPDDLYNIPLVDPKVIKGFKANDVVGIFQFDGRATRYVCGAVSPDNFAEVCDCGALSRPGPLHNGAAREYAEIKHDPRKQRVTIHPALEPILLQTKGQIVYQEQILRICREVGAFDWTHAAHIRTIISRKYGEAAFNKEWGRFWTGARTLHRREKDMPPMTEDVARAIWGDMITSGSYAFNAAHCVCYGLLGWWTQWFKQHKPRIFYAAALKHLGEKPEKQYDILRDAVRHGVEIRRPNPKRSAVSWSPVKRKLAVRAGFSQIDGIGGKTAEQIAKHRRDLVVETWDDLSSIKGIGAKTIDKIKMFVKDDDPFGIYKLDKNIEAVKADLKDLGLPLPTHRATDLPFEQGKTFPVVWLGTCLQRNVRDIFEQNRAKTGEELKPDDVRDPHLNEFILMTAEDETDQLLIKMDRWKFPLYKQGLFDMKLGHDLMLVEGYRPAYVTARQIKVRRLWVLEP